MENPANNAEISRALPQTGSSLIHFSRSLIAR